MQVCELTEACSLRSVIGRHASSCVKLWQACQQYGAQDHREASHLFDRRPPLSHNSHYSILMVRPSGRTPHPRHTHNSSLSARILNVALSPQSRQCTRMPPKRPIGGSGDAGPAEAPEHGMNMETEVPVPADEVEN